MYYLFIRSPGSGGENTYKLPGWSVSPHSLLFAAQSRGAARFLSSFFSLLLLFFSASIRAPRPRRSALTTYSRPHLYLFHLLFFCFHTTGAALFLFSGVNGGGAFLEEGRGAERHAPRGDFVRTGTKQRGCGGCIKGPIERKVCDSCSMGEQGGGLGHNR